MTVRRFDGFRWEDVALLAYKEGGPYKGVTRQVLFEGEESLPVQWRYFEVEPGGHSTLERHEHLRKRRLRPIEYRGSARPAEKRVSS